MYRYGTGGFVEGEIYKAHCVGTLGELFQGPLFTKKGTEISIISALAQIVTRATFTPGGACNLQALGKMKVKKSLSKFFEKISPCMIEGEWSFESDIIMGAGMSSSTSDIVSGLRCICSALDIIPTIDNIITCLKDVERSDSVFIDAINFSNRFV